MKTRSRLLVPAALVIGVLSAGAATPPAKVTSDILPPNRRQEVVDRAVNLAKPPAPVAAPTDMPQPFFPPDFDKPDDAKPGAAGPRPAGGPPAPAPQAPTQPAGPTGDRAILETLAARLTPSGTINFGASPQLIIGKNRFPVGTKFTVTFNNEDYELELVSIDRTTFTLRYRSEEFTRPIKPAR
ncbi:MAG: hypothetical protein Q7S40_05645 [Opitutaceae bacterium]|nr:hypothetical protein [Opitutaceae bacterium]